MKNISQIFENAFLRSINTKKDCLKIGFDKLEKMGIIISESIKEGGKLFLCGNGGSAADAQHLAAELLVRLKPDFDRSPLPAISLALDTSTITACANDYSFNDIFSRNLLALARPNDCLLAISTSGNSKNIISVLEMAKRLNVSAFSFLGGNGGEAKHLAEISFIVPSNNTASIQETHIVAGHALMEYIEIFSLK